MRTGPACRPSDPEGNRQVGGLKGSAGPYADAVSVGIEIPPVGHFTGRIVGPAVCTVIGILCAVIKIIIGQVPHPFVVSIPNPALVLLGRTDVAIAVVKVDDGIP